MSGDISIPELPHSETFTLEYHYWPWGKLINKVGEWVIANAPHEGFIVDYMCGTGFLLNRLAKCRPDLHLSGCSKGKDRIDYGKKYYSGISIECIDCFDYKPPAKVDVAICTGGIHHLAEIDKEKFIKKISSEINFEGTFLVGEEVLPEYKDDIYRRLAVVELGSALISSVIKNSAPDDVLVAAVDLMKRDLFMTGEYKSCLCDLKSLLKTAFTIEICQQIWPDHDTGFGDYILICHPK